MSRPSSAGALSLRGTGVVLVLMLAALLTFAASASAQAARTWVSGTGSDLNPCSRTAPCLTFAGAYPKTDAGGEIDALDPGDFGPLTITHSITIDGGGGQVAGVLASGTSGIVVAAGASDNVVLRNLRFDGAAGNGANLGTAGVTGVQFVSGSSLRLEDDVMSGFGQNGVLDINGGASSLVISNSALDDNFNDGVLFAPGSSSADGVVENSELESNACGLVVSTLGTGNGTCGTGTGGAVTTSASVTAFSSSLSANTSDGVLSAGGGSNALIGNDLVTENSVGIDPESSGQITTLCGDFIGGNGTDGSPTSATSSGCSSGGPAGPIGPTGPAGATGPAGPRGPAGKVELVVCKKVRVHHHRRTRCKGKLVSGKVKFKVAGKIVGATLTRAGRSYGSGTVTVGRDGEIGLMAVTRKLPAGRYTLKLWLGGRRIATRTLVVSR